jgi:hypothetical protein
VGTGPGASACSAACSCACDAMRGGWVGTSPTHLLRLLLLLLLLLSSPAALLLDGEDVDAPPDGAPASAGLSQGL